MSNDQIYMNDQELASVAGGTLTQDEALAKALEHAKLSKDEVDFVKKIGMDYEYGRQVYEIEFCKGRFEYEFDIDAETGRVLKFKKDWD